MIPAGAIKRFQSTLPAREATSGSGQIMCPGRISIHASCKGSDHSAGWCRYPGQYFNPRFPRRKRLNSHEMKTQFIGFQSTLPAGEATLRFVTMAVILSISIHASRGGSDRHDMRPCVPRMDFNPRFPRGKRRWLLRPCFPKLSISIHASRGGSDVSLPTVLWSACNFNPRFPRGKRLPFSGIYVDGSSISIHASRGGSDDGLGSHSMFHIDFNPRFPRGKRP